ncbi:unnamed protein product [Fasciola hepatica]|uniref:Uncharacterized protein n=1 Tax=Fasciola hepatica TaxID=6192 RepID=A0ABC9HF92_FASHE
MLNYSVAEDYSTHSIIPSYTCTLLVTKPFLDSEAVRSHSKLIQAHKRPSRLLHSCRLCVSVVYNSIWSFRRRPSLPRRIGQLYSLEEILG